MARRLPLPGAGLRRRARWLPGLSRPFSGGPHSWLWLPRAPGRRAVRPWDEGEPCCLSLRPGKAPTPEGPGGPSLSLRFRFRTHAPFQVVWPGGQLGGAGCPGCAMLCHSAVSDYMTPRTGARQAPLSMGFSRQEYWSGLPCPPPGDLPDPGIKLRSPALQVDSLPTEPSGNCLHRKGLFQKGQLVLLGFLKQASWRFRSWGSSQEHGPVGTLRRGDTQQRCSSSHQRAPQDPGGPSTSCQSPGLGLWWTLSLTGFLKLMIFFPSPENTHAPKALLWVVSEAHPRLPRPLHCPGDVPPPWSDWSPCAGDAPIQASG